MRLRLSRQSLIRRWASVCRQVRSLAKTASTSPRCQQASPLRSPQKQTSAVQRRRLSSSQPCGGSTVVTAAPRQCSSQPLAPALLLHAGVPASSGEVDALPPADKAKMLPAARSTGDEVTAQQLQRRHHATQPTGIGRDAAGRAAASQQQQKQQRQSAGAAASKQGSQAEAAPQHLRSRAEEAPDDLDFDTLQMLADIDLMMASRAAPTQAVALSRTGIPPDSGGVQGSATAAAPAGPEEATASEATAANLLDTKAADCDAGLKPRQFSCGAASGAADEPPDAIAAILPDTTAPAAIFATAAAYPASAGAERQLGSGVFTGCTDDDAGWDVLVAAPPAGLSDSRVPDAQHPACHPAAAPAGPVAGGVHCLAEAPAGPGSVPSRPSAAAAATATAERCTDGDA